MSDRLGLSGYTRLYHPFAAPAKVRAARSVKRLARALRWRAEDGTLRSTRGPAVPDSLLPSPIPNCEACGGLVRSTRFRYCDLCSVLAAARNCGRIPA